MWKKSNEDDTDEMQPITDTPRPQTQSAPAPSKASGSVIGSSIVVSGDISGSEDLLLVGKMEGTVNFPKNDIHVGPAGEVKADLRALKISVEGKVNGDLRGSERVVIKKSGRVEGNIIAPRVVLEDGCQFKGSVEMNMDSNTSSAKTKSSDETESPDDAPASKVNQYNSKIKTRATSAS